MKFDPFIDTAILAETQEPDFERELELVSGCKPRLAVWLSDDRKAQTPADQANPCRVSERVERVLRGAKRAPVPLSDCDPDPAPDADGNIEGKVLKEALGRYGLYARAKHSVWTAVNGPLKEAGFDLPYTEKGTPEQ